MTRIQPPLSTGGGSSIPGKAAGSDITTGTDDTLYLTSKALADAMTGKVGAAWTSYNPTTANITKGSGTLEASYFRFGKTIFFKIRFVLAADSAVGTSPSFTLPVTAYSSGYNHMIICKFLDASVGWCPALIDFNTTAVYPQAINTAGTYAVFAGVTALIPFTWGTSDEIDISGVYEAA